MGLQYTRDMDSKAPQSTTYPHLNRCVCVCDDPNQRERVRAPVSSKHLPFVCKILAAMIQLCVNSAQQAAVACTEHLAKTVRCLTTKEKADLPTEESVTFWAWLENRAITHRLVGTVHQFQ